MDGQDNPVKADVISQWMDERVPGSKVLIRSGDHEAHPLLRKLGIREMSTSRASLYLYNNEDDVKIFAEALARLAESSRTQSSPAIGA